MKVRQANTSDATQMCAVINPIITAGGTTAHEHGFDAARMISHYIAPEFALSCVVAEHGGKVLGFQSLEWCDPDWQGDGALPADWAVIATFVGNDGRGLGVGAAMFADTMRLARAAKVTVIDATIRADNAVGLRYYSKIGFVDYAMLPDVPLSDGSKIDRVRKRFDL